MPMPSRERTACAADGMGGVLIRESIGHPRLFWCAADLLPSELLGSTAASNFSQLTHVTGHTRHSVLSPGQPRSSKYTRRAAAAPHLDLSGGGETFGGCPGSD